jgi:hypothetical protein
MMTFSLQERLDPIDWATYEPYVWANEAALRPRTSVLYGLLTRLGQQGMDPIARGAPPGEANVMAVAKQVPFCPHLSCRLVEHAYVTEDNATC